MTLKEREKEHILYVLEKTHWDLEKTAHVLRISLSECAKKLKEHGLDSPENQSDSIVVPLDDNGGEEEK